MERVFAMVSTQKLSRKFIVENILQLRHTTTHKNVKNPTTVGALRLQNKQIHNLKFYFKMLLVKTCFIIIFYID